MTALFDYIRRKRKLRRSREGKIKAVLDAAGVDLVLDVGANVGQTGRSLRWAGYRGRIVSFEPVPSAHDALAARAHGDPLWRIAPRMAIGDRDTEITLNVSESTDMSSALQPTADLLRSIPKTRVTERVTAPMRRLDTIYDEYCPADATVFLKCDTQGYERKVLDGARDSLGRIRGLQFELSLFPLYENEETYLTHLNDLHDWGFEPYMIVETNFARDLSRQLQIDVVFLRGGNSGSAPAAARVAHER